MKTFLFVKSGEDTKPCESSTKLSPWKLPTHLGRECWNAPPLGSSCTFLAGKLLFYPTYGTLPLSSARCVKLGEVQWLSAGGFIDLTFLNTLLSPNVIYFKQCPGQRCNSKAHLQIQNLLAMENCGIGVVWSVLMEFFWFSHCSFPITEGQVSQSKCPFNQFH